MVPKAGYESRFKIYLGLNDKDVKDKEKDPSLIYKTKNIKLHPGWVHGEVFYSDLALLQV